MLARFIQIVVALAASHGHHDVARLHAVAEDIYAAATSAPVYCGDPSTDAAEYATALSMAGIVLHETGFAPDSQDCTRRTGDPAFSLFALNGPVAMGGHSKAEVCSNNLLAAILATQVLARFRCVGDLLTACQGYASGNTATKSRAAREIADLIATLLWRERIFVSFRNQCLEASYLP